MTSRPTRRGLSGALALAAALTASMQTSTAHAQASGSDAQLASARRGLVSDASAASHAGNHALALDLAERAGRIEMTPSLRLFIASEQATLGRISESLGNADLCVREVRANQQIHNAGSIETECQQLITQLTPRVGRIVLRVPSPLPAGYAVHIGGDTINPVFYGAPYRVTPGHLVIELIADGRPTLQRQVDVPTGGNVEVDASFGAPASPVVQAHPLPASSAPDTALQPASVTHAPPSTRAASSGVPIAPLVVGAVGVLALGGSALLYVLRVGALNDFNNTHCSSVGPDQWACDSDAATVNAFHGVETLNTATFVALGVGSAVVVGSALWFALSPRHRVEQAPMVAVAPLVGGGMISIGGAL